MNQEIQHTELFNFFHRPFFRLKRDKIDEFLEDVKNLGLSDLCIKPLDSFLKEKNTRGKVVYEKIEENSQSKSSAKKAGKKGGSDFGEEESVKKIKLSLEEVINHKHAYFRTLLKRLKNLKLSNKNQGSSGRLSESQSVKKRDSDVGIKERNKIILGAIVSKNSKFKVKENRNIKKYSELIGCNFGEMIKREFMIRDEITASVKEQEQKLDTEFYSEYGQYLNHNNIQDTLKMMPTPGGSGGNDKEQKKSGKEGEDSLNDSDEEMNGPKDEERLKNMKEGEEEDLDLEV